MTALRGPLPRILLVVFAGIASAAMLIASIALLVRVKGSGNRGRAVTPVVAAPAVGGVAAADAKAVGGRRFTLRLGQGFRFKDAAVVKQDDGADVVFKYLPPQVGGMALRYNEMSKQVETGLEPTLTSPVPLLVGTSIKPFEQRPDVAKITSGDLAEFGPNAPISSKARFVLLQSRGGDQYLLKLDELEAVPGKYDDWRIGFAYEQIQLPLGLAGGRISKALPGKLIFRDWYRTKMIVRVDLTSGKEEAIADGTLPSVVADRLIGYGDPSGAYVVRDAADKVVATVRFNEQVLGPLLSPDGTRLSGSVYRRGPEETLGGIKFAGKSMLSTGVFDLSGREVFSVVGYDDAAWTPDGKLIATGSLYEPGLFEVDPRTEQVTPIDAKIGCPLQPAVSPDGKAVAFVTGNKVWLIGRDGTNLRQLLRDGRPQQRPAFSPDGTKIAFVICTAVSNDLTGEVFVIDLKTQELTPLRTSTGAALVPDTTSRLNWVP